MNLRENWTTNDDGTPVPRRTRGSVAEGYGPKDFTLVCKLCGDDYGNEPDLPLGVVQEHFRQHHERDDVVLELLWLGQGPAPQGKPR